MPTRSNTNDRNSVAVSQSKPIGGGLGKAQGKLQEGLTAIAERLASPSECLAVLLLSHLCP